MASSVSFSLAFLAGLLSFVSPCVLPLVPVYLGYLSGSSLGEETVANRRLVLGHALFFVSGFTVVFVFLFGLPATLLGQGLFRYRDWIARLGGAVLILFGLHTVGLISIPILNATVRLDAPSMARPGHARSFLIGLAFAAGWTPCIGPLLGTVMTLALTEPAKGMMFLLVYALGLATPFLAVAALLTPAIRWLKRLNRYMQTIKIVSGALMVIIGILLLSGTLSLLSRTLIRFTPEWLLELI